MLSFEELYLEVEKTLSDKRFYHSKCVMEKCIELAEKYGENVEKAKIAGLLHDIAKEVPKNERIILAQKYNVELDEVELDSTGLIHAKLGAKICEKDFGIEKEICNAIACHTTGQENMTLLDKILYISDAIGVDRNYDNTEYLRKLAFSDLDKSVETLLKFTIEERLKEGKTIHIDSIKSYNYFIMKNK